MKTLPLIIAITMLVLPFVAIGLFWDQIPDTIPIHYNFAGEANNFGPKSWAIFILPSVNIFLFLLLYFMPKIDPKKQVSLDNAGYVMFMLLMVGFFFVLFSLELVKFLGVELPKNYMIYFFPLLFVITGNFLGKLRPNYFVGVRTPWTLEDADVWRKTHRFTGRLWMISSVLYIALALIFRNNPQLWMLIVYLVVIVVVPLLYSYLAFRQVKHDQPA